MSYTVSLKGEKAEDLEGKHWDEVVAKRYPPSRSLIIAPGRDYCYYFNRKGMGEVCEFIGDVKGKKILEIGCGVGNVCVYFARGGAEVWGCDISEGSIQVARRFAEDNQLEDRIHLGVMKIESLSYKNDFFNMVFGQSILHHTDLPRAIKEIHRVLKEGGRAVFIEPLAYHPLVWAYRKVRPQRYSPGEKPLRISDLKIIRQSFDNNVKVKGHRLLALYSHPAIVYRYLRIIDDLLCSIPGMKRLCATVVIMANK